MIFHAIYIFLAMLNAQNAVQGLAEGNPVKMLVSAGFCVWCIVLLPGNKEKAK